MRMPREPGPIVLRPVVAEVVEKEEWIERFGLAEAESAMQPDAGAFQGRPGVDDAFDGTDGHGSLHEWQVCRGLAAQDWR
ncbi:hypothetical protein D3C83_87270 [compost metagenome]